MRSPKILIRIDDVCPTMDWNAFEKVMVLLDDNKIKPLLGVIPDCRDMVLQINEPKVGFWEYIKELQLHGCTIAMHGFNHVFEKKSNGIVTRNKISEFAGLSYNNQLIKISKGLEIFNNHNIRTNVFFAPAHSYDDNTLRALNKCGFKYISDGYSKKPYERQGIYCIPCRSAGIPIISRNDYYTAVIHPHEWDMPNKVNAWGHLQRLVEEQRGNIVNFDEYVERGVSNSYIQAFDELVYFWGKQYIIPRLVEIKHLLKI